LNCKYCGAETRYIHKEGRPLQIENNKQHFCTLYDLLVSYSMVERNTIEIEHPPLRSFKHLSSYFDKKEKEEIRKAFLTLKKLKYKYWMLWLNIAITRMNKMEYKDYIRKVNLTDVSKRTH